MEQTTSIPDLLGVSALKARGWTDRLIQHHLGAPDMTRPNPHYRSAAPMRLFKRSRVEQIEQSPAWEQIMQATQHRQQHASKAVQTKRQKMLQYIGGVQITVAVIDQDLLTTRACEHYNRLQEERAERRGDWDFRPATPTSDGTFLARITVNYLRHVHSRYERELHQIFGKVGVAQGYLALYEKVSAAIAAAYPPLAPECARQADAKRQHIP